MRIDRNQQVHLPQTNESSEMVLNALKVLEIITVLVLATAGLAVALHFYTPLTLGWSVAIPVMAVPAVVITAKIVLESRAQLSHLEPDPDEEPEIESEVEGIPS